MRVFNTCEEVAQQDAPCCFTAGLLRVYYGFTAALLLGARLQHLRGGGAAGRRQAALPQRATTRAATRKAGSKLPANSRCSQHAHTQAALPQRATTRAATRVAASKAGSKLPATRVAASSKLLVKCLQPALQPACSHTGATAGRAVRLYYLLFATALLLIYHCFATALLLLYYCFTTALLLLHY